MKRKLEANLGVIPSTDVVSSRVVEELFEEDDPEMAKFRNKNTHHGHAAPKSAKNEDADSDEEAENEEDEDIGPLPPGAVAAKLRRRSSRWSVKRGSMSLESWRTTSPMNWTDEHVCDWIEQMGTPFNVYRPLFAEQKITGRSLVSMKESDLKGVCVNNPVHRMELYRRIRALKSMTLSGKQSRLCI